MVERSLTPTCNYLDWVGTFAHQEFPGSVSQFAEGIEIVVTWDSSSGAVYDSVLITPWAGCTLSAANDVCVDESGETAGIAELVAGSGEAVSSISITGSVR